MKKYKYLILGAGPTGLAVAHTLLRSGICSDELLLLEKESEAGGLCRSMDVDGSPIDIGGGHFLDASNKIATKFLFDFLPESEWNFYNRVSKIDLHNCLVDHPLEANIWQLPLSKQVDYLESIALSPVVGGAAMPNNFEDWIKWKFGEKIAVDYMIPYNTKIWSMDLNQLSTDWLYKLPNVSFKETLQSCLEKVSHGTLPAHGTFYYPKNYGYGEVWKRMGRALNGSLRLNYKLNSIDINTKTVNNEFEGEIIVNTIPWDAWIGLSDIPSDILYQINRLKRISIDVDYIPETIESNAHWIYKPDIALHYHRQLLRSNFIHGAIGHWREANSLRSPKNYLWRHRSEYAYPVNTKDKRESIEAISKWAKILGIVPAGRWGIWEHMNSDVAVAKGIQLGNELAKKR